VPKARNDMKDLVNRVAYGKERIYLTSHNKKMVALVPVEDLELLEEMELAADLQDAEERVKKVKEEGVYSSEELKKRLGL
jgi:prevent-host-death family protein